MTNDRSLSMKVVLDGCVDVEAAEGDQWLQPKEGMQALDYFAEVLRGYGLVVKTSAARDGRHAMVTIEHPYPWVARRLRSRGGGRPRKASHWPASMGETPEEVLAWVGAHGAAEGAARLGVSVSTYYRRVKELRESLAQTS